MSFWKTNEFHKVKGKVISVAVIEISSESEVQMRIFSCVSNFVQHLILEHTQHNRDATIRSKFLIFIIKIFPEYRFIKIRIQNYYIASFDYGGVATWSGNDCESEPLLSRDFVIKMSFWSKTCLKSRVRNNH